MDPVARPTHRPAGRTPGGLGLSACFLSACGGTSGAPAVRSLPTAGLTLPPGCPRPSAPLTRRSGRERLPATHPKRMGSGPLLRAAEGQTDPSATTSDQHRPRPAQEAAHCGEPPRTDGAEALRAHRTPTAALRTASTECCAHPRRGTPGSPFPRPPCGRRRPGDTERCRAITGMLRLRPGTCTQGPVPVQPTGLPPLWQANAAGSHRKGKGAPRPRRRALAAAPPVRVFTLAARATPADCTGTGGPSHHPNEGSRNIGNDTQSAVAIRAAGQGQRASEGRRHTSQAW